MNLQLSEILTAIFPTYPNITFMVYKIHPNPIKLYIYKTEKLSQRLAPGQVVYLLADQGVRCPGFRRHDERPAGGLHLGVLRGSPKPSAGVPEPP